MDCCFETAGTLDRTSQILNDCYYTVYRLMMTQGEKEGRNCHDLVDESKRYSYQRLNTRHETKDGAKVESCTMSFNSSIHDLAPGTRTP